MSAAFDYDANLAKVLNDPERLEEIYDPYEDPDDVASGESEILAPIEYLERGNAVLKANRIAINNTPRREVAYPHWNIRYGMAKVLTELGIEYEGHHWSEYNLSSKEVVKPENKEKYQHLRFVNVAQIYASAKIATIFTSNQWEYADFDIPGVDTPRLWNSELLFQAWRDTCAAHSSQSGGDIQSLQALQMKKLKYVIIAPISNDGTAITLSDALKIKGLSIEDNELKMVTFSSNDISTASAEFRMLMGTANARPVARMLTDHAESLGAKRVVKIHACLLMPDYNLPMLAFELAGEDPPAPAPRKLGRKIGVKVQNLMKKFEH
ncbi:hypothetical protein BOTCAL_0002g00400 [Botryotinia calthae]|uniref:Uncharacterized protein n=1 Tax=Botryotinia calthae TaxID=38488 RepID=A0A4Y8DKH9_9HELO|nr:hypothetical protein BOTCAL_0002g00400 [Botryotinia calthae]